MTKQQEFLEYVRSLHVDFVGTPANDEMKNRHHRQEKCRGGAKRSDGGRKNISIVPVQKHHAWNILFNRMTPQQIANEINDVWLNPDYKFNVVHLKDLNHEKES